ncbi:MAG: hypothetical protein LIR40_08080 [Bacteroidota bacterium]|nr:hypothetical protein [Bacteroidota bacterium]
MAQATVKDVAEWFNKLVSEGKGDYYVDVDDNFGGGYGLDKGDRYGYVDNMNKFVSIGDLH